VAGSAAYIGGPSPITLTQSGQNLNWDLGRVSAIGDRHDHVSPDWWVPVLRLGTKLANNVLITDTFGNTEPVW